MEVIRKAGVLDLVTRDMVDVFSGSPHESDAKDFDTRGIAFRAVKPR